MLHRVPIESPLFPFFLSLFFFRGMINIMQQRVYIHWYIYIISYFNINIFMCIIFIFIYYIVVFICSFLYVYYLHTCPYHPCMYTHIYICIIYILFIRRFFYTYRNNSARVSVYACVRSGVGGG